MNPEYPIRKQITSYIRFLLLPMLIAIYPVLFHYGNNVDIVLLSSLVRMLALCSLLAIAVYIFFLMFKLHQPIEAANAAFIFLVFFNIYGLVYTHLLKMDIVRITHFTFLPFFVLLSLYLSWLVTLIKMTPSVRFWNSMVYIFSILIVFNIVKIIPVEIDKVNNLKAAAMNSINTDLSNESQLPDIYYIVLDEYSGFKPMREYWKNNGIDDFVRFLKLKGFYVAEDSHSNSESTLYELATRLNYQYYPCCDSYLVYYDAIAASKVTHYLNSRGYTIIAFEELKDYFPASAPFQADYLYESDPDSPPVSEGFFDDFGILVIDNTILYAFPNIYKPYVVEPFLKNHRNMIYYTVDKIADLEQIKSPKFVYVHLLLPHVPFMFDANGNVIDRKHRNDWNYYLDNYIFATRIAENMVTNILSHADVNTPPIIILQSDHGARNQIIQDNKETLLRNFPDDFKTSIMFTLYMPGCDSSVLTQDMNPINTFPIIFNCYFDAGIPLK
jgi:hypothetical protein